MPQNHRHQNESRRGPDYPSTGYRSGSRDRYDTGGEHRYAPQWDERFYESRNQDEVATSFDGDRSYSAGGYPEEFGYRREAYAERGRSAPQRYSGAEGRGERSSGSYYHQPYERSAQNFDYGAHDYPTGPGGQWRSSQARDEANRYDFNRGRFYASNPAGSGGTEYAGSNYYHDSQVTQPNREYGREAGGSYGGEHSWGNDTARHLQQSYRGRGPKGYERSDERIRELICERLTDDPYIDASEVTVEVNNKVVKLTGSIEDRRAKYLIEDVIEQCGGVRDIDNQLRVQSSQGQLQGSQTHTQSAQAYSQTGPSASPATQQYSTSDTSLTNRSNDKSLSSPTKRN